MLLATFVVVGFAVTLESLHLPARACEVGQCSTECLDVLRDDSLSDREKEEALQQRAQRLFKLLGILVGGSALALGLPLLGVWFVEQLGIGSYGRTLAVLQRIDFLAGVTVVGVLGYLVVRRVRAS